MVPPADDAEDGDGARALETNSAVLTRRRYSLCSPSHSGLTITIVRADGEDIEDEDNKWKELGLQNAG